MNTPIKVVIIVIVMMVVLIAAGESCTQKAKADTFTHEHWRLRLTKIEERQTKTLEDILTELRVIKRELQKPK